MGGKLSPEIYGQLGEAIQAGYPTIKMFTTDTFIQRKGNMIGMGDMWEVFQVAAREGGRRTIHGEDNDIVMHMYEKLLARGAPVSSTSPRCTTPCPRTCPSGA